MKNKEIEELLNELKDKDNYIEEYGWEFKRIGLDNTKLLLSYIEQLEKDKKELEERYNLVCKISEERKNKWLSLNEENEILFNTLKKYKLECESNGKIIHQLQNNRDKAIEYINEMSGYDVEDYIRQDLLLLLKGDSDDKK